MVSEISSGEPGSKIKPRIEIKKPHFYVKEMGFEF